MSNYKQTAEFIDKLLLFGLGSGILASSIVVPGSIVGLAPVLDKYMEGYSKREREREYRRIVNYMRRQRLVSLEPKKGNGLVLTEKGIDRAKKAAVDSLVINTDKKWDGNWHIAMFDIPEDYKRQRDLLSSRLKTLGLFQLQKSVWLYPYEMRKEVAAIAIEYGVERYVTLIEATNVDHHNELKNHFKNVIKT